MDNFPVLIVKMLGIADHAIVKPGTDRHQHIAVLHRHIRFISAVHTQHTQGLLIGTRVTAQSH
jgi:hypothetical protein